MEAQSRFCDGVLVEVHRVDVHRRFVKTNMEDPTVQGDCPVHIAEAAFDGDEDATSVSSSSCVNKSVVIVCPLTTVP